MNTRPRFQHKVKPYDHQALVLERTWQEAAWGLFLDMGCGKSKIFLDTTTMLYCAGRINGAIILAPKGVYGNWSDPNEGQIVTHVQDDVLVRSRVLKWRENHQTKKFQTDLKHLLETPEDDLAFFVINAEATRSVHAIRAMVQFLKSRKVIIGVDESTLIKNPKAQVTQKIIALGRGARYRRAMTGTPVTNSPLDVYAPFEFLDPTILGFNNFFSFRARYALLVKQQIGQRQILKINGFQRQDELRQRMERGSVIMKKEDCLDLPEKVFHVRNVELSSRQRQMYHQMRLLSLAQLDEEKVVTADLALTKLLRLHQITLGFVSYVDENGEKHEEGIDENGGPRVTELLNLVEEIGPEEKVIIWCNYNYNINTVAKALRSTYEPFGTNERVVAVYNGETPQELREAYVRDFQDPTNPLRYFVGNPSVGGFGLTLTRSAHAIYYSNDFSLEKRLQSEDRIHRIGQHRSTNYTDMRAKGTVDDKIISVLKSKKNLADELTDGGWRRFLEAEAEEF